MKIVFLISGIIIISFSSCKKSGRILLEEIANNPQYSDEFVYSEIAKRVFGNQLKGFRYDEEGKKISIEFGENSALTFQNPDNYERDHKLVLAVYQVRYLQPLQQRMPNVLVMSLVKPFYVMEEKVNREIIEEFEIFRVRLDIKQFSQIKDIYSVNPNTSDEKEKKIRILDEIINLWKVELNEFKRIELK
jgi:hypothetical protein